jgi:exonuclease SbcC
LDIRLLSQSVKHFKGINDFKLQVNGQNASIFGDNGTGKTTQFDADQWVKFGKDSTDRSQFKVKPQDAEGNDIHYLQTEVEQELLVDGKRLKIKKMQEEKWTKKHGTDEKALTGNTISYWWDEVPSTETEYKLKISQLIDENIFRMITNPMFFNTKVPWQDRRKILLEICGDMTDAEVIASDKKLSRLTDILSGRSIDDYKKILNENIRKLEKDREGITPRIDELSLTIPQVQPDYTAVEVELQRYKDQMAGIELEMTNASNVANAFRKKQQDLYGLKGKLANAQTRIDNAANSGSRGLVDEKSRLSGEKYRLESDINGFKTRIDQNNRTLESNAKEREKLLATWRDYNETKAAQMTRQFTEPDENSFSCPMCGQSLPNGAKESKLEEMRKNFEKEKASNISWCDRELAKNKEAGISLKSSNENLQKAIEECGSKLAEAEAKLNEVINRLAEIEALLSAPTAAPDYSADPEYATLQKQIADLQAELEKPVEDTTSALLQSKREVQANIDACNKTLNSRDTTEKNRKRIIELGEEQKQIGAKITELEGHQYLIDQLIITKANLLESNINGRFRYVRFKMFNLQVNGGVDPCCEAMVNTNGSYVPFSEANHAGKVNAGLDIINTLCAYYGVTAPIFIDFRESVSKIIETRSQVINLVKSEPDKSLRVEVE